MTESEAFKDIKENILPCVGGKSLVVAIKALEKQEKIKAVFTHYVFSGNEIDMCNDCISALSEIKTILKE